MKRYGTLIYVEYENGTHASIQRETNGMYIILIHWNLTNVTRAYLKEKLSDVQYLWKIVRDTDMKIKRILVNQPC